MNTFVFHRLLDIYCVWQFSSWQNCPRPSERDKCSYRINWTCSSREFCPFESNL